MMLNDLSKILKSISEKEYNNIYNKIESNIKTPDSISKEEYYDFHHYSWFFSKNGGVKWHTNLSRPFPNPYLALNSEYIDYIFKRNNLYDKLILISIKFSLENNVNEAHSTEQYNLIPFEELEKYYKDIKGKLKSIVTNDFLDETIKLLENEIDAFENENINWQGISSLIFKILNEKNYDINGKILEKLTDQNNKFWFDNCRSLSEFKKINKIIAEKALNLDDKRGKLYLYSFLNFSEKESISILKDFVIKIKNDIIKFNAEEKHIINNVELYQDCENLMKILNTINLISILKGNHKDKLDEILQIESEISFLVDALNENKKYWKMTSVFESRQIIENDLFNYLSRLNVISGHLLITPAEKSFDFDLRKNSLSSFFLPKQDLKYMHSSSSYKIFKEDNNLTDEDISKNFSEIKRNIDMYINNLTSYIGNSNTWWSLYRFATGDELSYEEFEQKFKNNFNDREIVELIVDKSLRPYAIKNEISTKYFSDGKNAYKSESKILEDLLKMKKIHRNLAFLIGYLTGNMGFNLKNDFSHSRRDVSEVEKKLAIIIACDLKTLMEEIEYDAQTRYYLERDYEDVDLSKMIKIESRSCKVDENNNIVECEEWKPIKNENE